MIFTNRKLVFNFQIKMGNNNIKQTNQTNYLGVIIDSKLNWKPYLNYIKNKMVAGLSTN